MPFWRLYYHLVWATEGREPMIRPEIEYQVYDIIKSKVAALGGTVHEVGGIEDHIHLAATVPPSISLSKFVGEVKGASAYHVNHLPDSAYRIEWQRGYGAVSFRRDNLDQVTAYVRRQKEHHSSATLWPSLEDCGDGDALKPPLVKEARAEYDPWG